MSPLERHSTDGSTHVPRELVLQGTGHEYQGSQLVSSPSFNIYSQSHQGEMVPAKAVLFDPRGERVKVEYTDQSGAKWMSVEKLSQMIGKNVRVVAFGDESEMN